MQEAVGQMSQEIKFSVGIGRLKKVFFGAVSVIVSSTVGGGLFSLADRMSYPFSMFASLGLVAGALAGSGLLYLKLLNHFGDG